MTLALWYRVVMENKTPSVGPKDFFLWLAATAALYVSVICLLVLWFEYIDRLWGDAASTLNDPFSSGIRIAFASLAVIFPLYIWFMRMLHQDARHNPEKRELWVRRWLLVLSLFVAGITIVIDLIVLINAFLGGQELTIAFLLKILAVLLVVGGGFWYYLQEIKGVWDRQKFWSEMIAGAIGVAVLLTLGTALYFIGSPADQRARRMDQMRVSALQNIQWQITDYYQQKETLPPSLEVLRDPLRGTVIEKDPVTGEAYVYRTTGNLSFELCATFESENLDQQAVARTTDVYIDPQAEYWTHGIGEVCFDRTIDPDRYPPYNKGPVPVGVLEK